MQLFLQPLPWMSCLYTFYVSIYSMISAYTCTSKRKLLASGLLLQSTIYGGIKNFEIMPIAIITHKILLQWVCFDSWKNFLNCYILGYIPFGSYKLRYHLACLGPSQAHLIFSGTYQKTTLMINIIYIFCEYLMHVPVLPALFSSPKGHIPLDIYFFNKFKIKNHILHSQTTVE